MWKKLQSAFACGTPSAGLPSRSSGRRKASRTAAKAGGEGGIRTPVPVTRQDAFEAPPLRPLRYLSARGEPSLYLPAPALEELLDDRAALLFEHAGNDLDAMIEERQFVRLAR